MQTQPQSQLPPNMEPTLYIDGKPFYITYVGVDRNTGEILTPETEKPDNTNITDRTDRFAGAFGYVRKGTAVQDGSIYCNGL